MPNPNTSELAVAHCEAAAQVLRQHLIECRAYRGRSARLTGPAMLAYFVGWCEETLRKVGLTPESEQGLDVLGSMLWVIFDESLLSEAVSNGAIATAYFDFRRAVLRKDAAVQEAYRAGAQDLARYEEKGSRPARLSMVLKAHREPAAEAAEARRA